MNNYFNYSPASPEMRRWGLAITASGFTRVPPKSKYPILPHPQDHHFEWTGGRVLNAMQVVLISSGGGWLQTRLCKKARVEPGMVFLLLPGIWHRYRPDADTGWDESWIEIQGPIVDELVKARTFPAKSVLRAGAVAAGLDESLDTVHQRVRSRSNAFDPELSAVAMHVLAICEHLGSTSANSSHIQIAVRDAERYLGTHSSEAISIESLAANQGISYSRFRRAFREKTGFSPWQYVIHLRLLRARRLLASTDSKLDEIAARVGFSSGYHLSTIFKQSYGLSPTQWRSTVR